MIQTHILFVKGLQQMVVQTWEKVRSPDKAKQQECYIKSLRFFNGEAEEVGKILVEQVFAESSTIDMIEASYYKNEENIYYFKRIYHPNGPASDLDNSRLDASFDISMYMD